MDAFENTVKKMRDFEKSAETCRKNSKVGNYHYWMKLAREFDMKARMEKITIDSHIVTNEVREGVHNG